MQFCTVFKGYIINLLAIIDFYVTNSLDFTGVNYDDKLCHFGFFGGKSLTINTIKCYCTYRTLQGVKNATINRELAIVRSAVNFYNKHHNDQIKNPLNGFKLFEEEFIPRHLTVRQCQDLLSHAKDYNGNDLLYHFINLLLNTGCRRGELLKLEWKNVHLKTGYLTVLNSLSKNRKTIHKPLNRSALQSLQALKVNNPS